MSLSQVQTALAAYPGIRLAYVFGSVATGHVRPDSDVDVAVLMEHPLDTTHRMQLIETLTLATGRPVARLT